MKLLFGPAPDVAEFRRRVLDNAERVRSEMLARSTQTNEPGRCATLLPVLSGLPQPLALIEVGASAGLCLLPDLYGYDFGRGQLPPRTEAAPLFRCVVDEETPVPTTIPQVAWRAGLDLEPIDLSDPDQVAWLEALVWPEETERLARLRQAVEIAKTERPRVIKGDLIKDLPKLAAEAPDDATLVVFHTAVVTYVDKEQRSEFVRVVQSVADVWVANEAPSVFPDITEKAGGAGPRGRYLMSVNGEPVAWADFHGAWMQWIADPPARAQR